MEKVQIEKLERSLGQMDGLHREINALAKKSPNDAVNEFKLKFINEVLSEANKFLGNKYRPLAGFDRFEVDAAPSNSDVTFILAQYIEAFESYRSKHIDFNIDFGKWFYQLDVSKEKIWTSPPRSISRRGK